MKRLRHHLAVVVASVVIISAALVGVAGSSPAGAARKAPVTIGVICSCSGPLASSVEVGPPGFQAWADYQNTKGGLNGHPIHVIEMNDSASSTTALLDVTKMVSSDHIVALVDDSNADSAFETYIDAQHIPVIGGGSQSDLDLSDPNWFAPGETVDEYFLGYMLAAKKVRAHVIGQFYCAESPICQKGVATFKRAAAAEHIKAAYITSISYASPNYTAQCLAAKQAGVQILNVADAVSVVQHVASNCLTQGYQPWEVAFDGGVSISFIHSPGIKNKFIGGEDDIPFFAKTPGTKLMNAAFKKYVAAQTLKSPNYNELSVENWITGLIIAQAVRNATAGTKGRITSAQIYQGLYSLHDFTAGGMAPPLTYHKGKPTPIDCFFWVRIQHGKFTTPYGLKPLCQKSIT